MGLRELSQAKPRPYVGPILARLEVSIRKLFASDRGLFANGGKSIMMGTHCCRTFEGEPARESLVRL